MLRDQLPILIGETPLRSVDITAASGQTRTAVNRCLGRLHKKGLIHIAQWYKERHIVAAMYKWGCGKDAKRPDPEHPAQAEKRYRENKVALDPDYYKNLRKIRAAKPIRVKSPPPIDALFSTWAMGSQCQS